MIKDERCIWTGGIPIRYDKFPSSLVYKIECKDQKPDERELKTSINLGLSAKFYFCPYCGRIIEYKKG